MKLSNSLILTMTVFADLPSKEAFSGLEIEDFGRFLLAGLNRARRWEIGGSLDFDCGNDGKRILFNMAPSWSETIAILKFTFWEVYLRMFQMIALLLVKVGRAAEKFDLD